ncbi:DUF4913 domain-containing protein [Microbacterium sp. KSW2-21]|uniref:DUF4913 domain-containing protein n=1 Tax=Microbacterium algihabitans TaxID=3075992 RepID=A0ABU3S024_9MICO|nr:DUF4913 domain-containing protein [Microbacterium sp. KSW2-21]MDU0328476.1 DUF4913 domain-containing protein [Microbacterium sp. KSW2-21]
MSDDWGDDDGIEAEPFDVDDEEREPGHIFGIDVAELVDGMARPAIVRSLQKAVRDLAAEVVDAEVTEQLDPSVIEELQLQAATAARSSVLAALDELDKEPTGEEPELYFGSVDEFVRGYLLPNYRRRVDGQRVVWAAEWWRYAEAVARLDALWRAWEHLRQDAQTGMSVWFRDHAEHHMSILLSPEGPFASAGEGTDRQNTNEKGQPLPYIAPPEGLFPDVREP